MIWLVIFRLALPLNTLSLVAPPRVRLQTRRPSARHPCNSSSFSSSASQLITSQLSQLLTLQLDTPPVDLSHPSSSPRPAQTLRVRLARLIARCSDPVIVASAFVETKRLGEDEERWKMCGG